jgi:[glutamine synthetase] adenylyltransferase / [glutamine synthetase]-adenylyl-L-tyrosine phosphorylase
MDKGDSQSIMAGDRPPLTAADAPASTQRVDTRLWQRVQRRHPVALSLLSASELHPLAQPGNLAAWGQFFGNLLALGLKPQAALRVMRQVTLARLSEWDQHGNLSLGLVTQAMTNLAEFALGIAYQAVASELSAVHGQPQTNSGQAMHLWIVGMGKLGGRELNVSSDIDLVYVYPADGDTLGRDSQGLGSISHHEWFAKAAKGLQRWLADVTEDGFVFRIDLALRPHGASGPVVCSLSALKDYLVGQGREWERLAWMKSRVIMPSLNAQDAQAIRDLVTPFVYRRYLDYPVFDALRELHGQIRSQASKRAVGRPNRAQDVKLGRGGIREIEFLVQSQQIVRGGQFPELRTRSTLKGLERLTEAGLLERPVAQALADAYTWLRRVEHRIQYQDDAHTHELPSADADLCDVAMAMGFDTPCGLLRKLDEVREAVATAFDAQLGQAAPEDTTPSQQSGLLALNDHPQLAQRVSDLLAHPKHAKLKPRDAQRLERLVRQTCAQVLNKQCSELAGLRMLDWLQTLLQREGYLALLVERPAVAQRVQRLLGSSAWVVQYVRQFPSVVDELAQAHWLHERFDAAQFASELQSRRAALALGNEDDDEALMNLLRRAHHAQVFRTLARDLEGLLSVEQVADDLSALADAVLGISLQWIWQGWWKVQSPRAHRANPQLAVVAYGKLGGKELGYGSDLDLVFIHDDPHDRAQECYAHLAKRLINWMSTKTALGDLYEIDTALRPNGNSGLLVTEIASFENYQSQRGGNAAWTWEHQAITRARVVLGPPDLAQRIETVRKQVLCAERDEAGLKAEITHMRRRLATVYPVPVDQFDPKHSAGGMLDCEFAVQTLVLLHAKDDPVLQTNPGNIALLEAADRRWLPTGVGHAAAVAYRHLRAHQHGLRLEQQQTSSMTPGMAQHTHAVVALWQALGLVSAPSKA